MLLTALLGVTGGGISTLLGTTTATLDRVSKSYEMNLALVQAGLFQDRTRNDLLEFRGQNLQGRKLVTPPPHPALQSLAFGFKQRNLFSSLRMREQGGPVLKRNGGTSPRHLIRPPMAISCLHRHTKTIGHLNAIYCVAYDCTGQILITGSDDRNVKMWCVRTCFLLCVCRGHTGDITDLAVSHNNSLFASASNDFTIRVWSMRTGLPVNVLTGHVKPVTMISFSPSGTAAINWPFFRADGSRVSSRDSASMGHDLLVSSSEDGTVVLWNAKDKAITPITMVDATRSLERSTQSQNSNTQAVPMNHCVFNPRGNLIAAAGGDTFVHVWHFGQNRIEYHILRRHRDEVSHLDFAHAGDRLLSVSMKEGVILVWAAKRGRGQAGCAPQEWEVAHSLSNPVKPGDSVARVEVRRHTRNVSHEARMVNWSSDDRWIVGSFGDNTVKQWNSATGELVHVFTDHTKASYVVVPSPFDPRLCASAGYDGKLVIMNMISGYSKVFEVGQYDLLDGKWSPDGQHLVVSDDVGTIYFYDIGRSHVAYTWGLEKPEVVRAPEQQFLRREFVELVMDEHGNVVDKERMQAPHRLPPDFLGNAEKLPYKDPVQHFFRSRYLYYNLPASKRAPSAAMASSEDNRSEVAIPSSQPSQSSQELSLTRRPGLSPNAADRTEMQQQPGQIDTPGAAGPSDERPGSVLGDEAEGSRRSARVLERQIYGKRSYYDNGDDDDNSTYSISKRARLAAMSEGQRPVASSLTSAPKTSKSAKKVVIKLSPGTDNGKARQGGGGTSVVARTDAHFGWVRKEGQPLNGPCIPYVPQLGDRVFYLRQAHFSCLQLYGLTNRMEALAPWFTLKDSKGRGAGRRLRCMELCEVEKMEYDFAESGDVICVLELKLIDTACEFVGRVFTVELPSLTCSDFLLLETMYTHSHREWQAGDRCSVWWPEEQEGSSRSSGRWWSGQVASSKPKEIGWSESPWEQLLIMYDNDHEGEPQRHGFWELKPPVQEGQKDVDPAHWTLVNGGNAAGRMDDTLRQSLLARVNEVMAVDQASAKFKGMIHRADWEAIQSYTKVYGSSILTMQYMCPARRL
eukprot:scaffold1637_cov410-Prasinococcus_capsulatus_cf.AAC.29